MRTLLLILSVLFLANCGSPTSGKVVANSAKPQVPGVVVPAPTASPASTPVPTPTPSPSPSATPAFVALNCQPIGNTSISCTKANLGNASITLNFDLYLDNGAFQIVSVSTQNNLAQGQPFGNFAAQQCQSEYMGLTNCSCVTVTFQEVATHTLSSPTTWCGTGINTTTNFLDYL